MRAELSAFSSSFEIGPVFFKEMYELHSCSFLIDRTDTVQHYEEVGKLLHESGSYDPQSNLMRLFNQQDRTQQIEMAMGMYTMHSVHQ